MGIAIMGTVAATAAKDQLSAGPLTHAVLSRAAPAGFAAALELAGLIAVAGFVIAFVAVRRPPARFSLSVHPRSIERALERRRKSLAVPFKNYYRRSGLAADDRARAPEAAGVSQAGPS